MCNTHDSLWIDTTSKTPYPLRKNGYSIIKKDNEAHKYRKIYQKHNKEFFLND